MKCPLCGFEFSTEEMDCKGCPMNKGCGLLRCPNCGYEFVAESRLVNFIKKIFKIGNSHERTENR